MFEIKYFIILTIFFELMMSYFLLSAVYQGYKQKRVKFNKLALVFVSMLIILFVTLAIAILI